MTICILRYRLSHALRIHVSSLPPLLARANRFELNYWSILLAWEKSGWVKKRIVPFFFLTKFAKLFDLERKFDFKSEEREEGNIEKYIIHPYIYMYIYMG